MMRRVLNTVKMDGARLLVTAYAQVAAMQCHQEPCSIMFTGAVHWGERGVPWAQAWSSSARARRTR